MSTDKYPETGLIAQLEERGVCNAEAGGSNPPETTGTNNHVRVGVSSRKSESVPQMHPEMRITGEGPRVL